MSRGVKIASWHSREKVKGYACSKWAVFRRNFRLLFALGI